MKEGILKSIKEVLAFTGLNESVTTLLTALLILFVGALMAKGLRRLVKNALSRTSWDEKLLGKSLGEEVDTNNFFAKLVYYIFMIVVLMIVLEVMGISQVLDPIKNMLNEMFSFIPNLLAAGIIGFVGYIIAKFVSNLISMTGTFADKFIEKTGFKDTDKLVDVLKKVAFIVILIPFIIQALNALNLNAITGPANQVLSSMMGVLPNLIGASIVIALFVIGGRFLTRFVQDLLKSLGTDELPAKIQLQSVIGEGQSLSKILSGIMFFFLVFFGIITGVEMLELNQLTQILNEVLSMSGKILFGLIILVLGNFIAGVIYNTLSKSEDNRFVASIVRFAIIGLFLAISLRTMGIANSIVELAFGLTLGAVAVAVALAYGLGGREAAGEHAKQILKKFTKK